MSDDARRREEIKSILASSLKTEVFPRADDQDMVQATINRLQTSDRALTTKLVISGFTLTPVDHGGIEQLCESCMYYQIHRRYCELPEHDVPVEPEWSCRLWRI